ncbi:carbamoyltransferase C-terminal domain-containing protein [Halobacteriovorax sp. HLS]|uniref:carbamoyltransferase C-terminal domain-containing protein n=1 Tax=Halobacteriovorax sp. HLS TaxID=2234000 RepID=UPI000FD87ECF|nr:carbamoyltransferase C-terminal domain-containing protein [Halobacteriovorax sp. HLS]
MKKQTILGISKTLYSSGVAKYENDLLELILSERLNKKKYSGEWPWRALSILSREDSISADCRDVLLTKDFEFALNQNSPFDEFLEKKSLKKFTSRELKHSLAHHYAHALSGITFTREKKVLVMVIDGAGSSSLDIKSLERAQDELSYCIDEKSYEGISFYKLENNHLTCLEKKFYPFIESKRIKKVLSKSPGMLFEFASEFIFNNKNDAGKVMGLSAFGKAQKIDCPMSYIESLDWDKSFRGKDKSQWESSEHMDLYKNVAASVQKFYEEVLLEQLSKYENKFSHVIIVGGGALNCVANFKLIQNKKFKSITIPPIPGDEGISVGIIQHLYHRENGEYITSETPYLGKNSDYICEDEIKKYFAKYNIKYLAEDLVDEISSELVEGKVLGWFQGRSESGPRALGNRSILARVDRNDLKNYLNSKIKFREEFRPYACSVLFEYADEYFKIDSDFKSPYMSFTIPVKEKFKDLFKEVTHVDGTSRAQIIEDETNLKYASLIRSVGHKTGIYAVLNTSLNVMGQPIVEDLNDLLIFFESSNVDGIVVGDYYVTK